MSSLDLLNNLLHLRCFFLNTFTGPAVFGRAGVCEEDRGGPEEVSGDDDVQRL